MVRVVAVFMVVVGAILIKPDMLWLIPVFSAINVEISAALILSIVALVLFVQVRRRARRKAVVPAYMTGNARSDVVTLIPWITTADLLWWREQTPPETWVRRPTIAERLSHFVGISRPTIDPRHKQHTPVVTVELTADASDGIPTAPLPPLESVGAPDAPRVPADG